MHLISLKLSSQLIVRLSLNACIEEISRWVCFCTEACLCRAATLFRNYYFLQSNLIPPRPFFFALCLSVLGINEHMFWKFGIVCPHMWLMIGQKLTELKKGNQGNQGNQATKGIHDFFYHNKKKYKKNQATRATKATRATRATKATMLTKQIVPLLI